MANKEWSMFFEVVCCGEPTEYDAVGCDGMYIKEIRAKKPWWQRMQRGDIAAELSATFDLGLDVCVKIADWMGVADA